MVGITIGAGAAVFGYINGQAGASENLYGQNVAKNVNYLSEHFVIITTQFSHSGKSCQNVGGYCNQANVSIYNNGALDLTVTQITLVNIASHTPGGASVPTISLTSNATRTTVTGACVGSSPSGFSPSPAQPVRQNAVPPTVFTVSLPSSCAANQGILVGASYRIAVLGLYGNQVTTQVTAAG